MKIKLDEEVIFEIDERMMKLLAHDLLEPIEEIKRRLRWVIEHKCDQSFERIKKEWLSDDGSGQTKAGKSGLEMIPTSKTAFVDSIFGLKSYKNRVEREAE